MYDTNLIAFRKLTDDEGVRVSNTCTDILLRLAIPPMVLNVLWVFAGIVEYGVLVHRKRMADKNGVDRRVENPYDRQREGLTTLARRIQSALQRDVKDFFTEFLRRRATSRTMRVFLNTADRIDRCCCCLVWICISGFWNHAVRHECVSAQKAD